MIYMDNAATTPLNGEVLQTMMPYLTTEYGNASTLYSIGRKAHIVLEKSRKSIAQIIGAKASEIYFTSGGSESDSWAIIGTALTYANKGKHIITSKIEHHAVLKACSFLEKQGYQITYLDVNKDGFISIKELQEAIKPETILISIMTANNEIGTIQPIKEIGEIALKNNVIFHTDAVQAFGHIAIDVDYNLIDLLSVSAHKIYGPKGVGCLYMRSGVKLDSIIFGGEQERGRRGGTENIAGIVGFSKAAEIASEKMQIRNEKTVEIRDYIINRVLQEIPGSSLNGSLNNRLSGNINFCFEGIEGEQLLTLLDEAEIYAGSGSACASGATEPSHVLLALGVSHELAYSSLRLTIDHNTTKKDADFVVNELKKDIEKLRG